MGVKAPAQIRCTQDYSLWELEKESCCPQGIISWTQNYVIHMLIIFYVQAM